MDMAQFATLHDMAFHYIPVEHGDVPSAQAALLATALLQTGTPAVLYCRTGNRAVRTYALVLAMKGDGPDEEAILDLARKNSSPVDDLRLVIRECIIARHTAAGLKP